MSKKRDDAVRALSPRPQGDPEVAHEAALKLKREREFSRWVRTSTGARLLKARPKP